MDLFQIPRNLLYETRTNIEDFGVNDGRTVDSCLYHNLTNDKYNISIGMFNDAYYICTLVMIDSTPDEHIPEYEKIVTHNASDSRHPYYKMRKKMVYGMVYVYLKCIASAYDAKYRKFRNRLRLSTNIESAILLSHTIETTISDSVFAPRKLTRELLDETDWNTLTNGYKLDDVLKIRDLFGRTASERMTVFNAILRKAQTENANSNMQFERIRALKQVKDRLSDPRYSFRDDNEEKDADIQISERVKDISEKIGEATIPLKILVEGVKKRAQLKGLEAAIELFENLNNILCGVPEWGKNVPELEKYFIEAREKREAKARGILMTGNHATYNENNNK